MDEDKLKNIIEEVVIKAIEPVNEKVGKITERLDDPENGLVAIKQTLDFHTETLKSHTVSLIEIESTNKIYQEMYGRNNENTVKLGKRMDIVEEELGVNPPEELILGEVS